MAARVYREEILMIDGGEQFEVETWGDLHLMPRGARSVFAIFGQFERTSDGRLLYTMGAEEMDIDACDSHYLDDLRALREGNVEIVERMVA